MQPKDKLINKLDKLKAAYQEFKQTSQEVTSELKALSSKVEAEINQLSSDKK